MKFFHIKTRYTKDNTSTRHYYIVKSVDAMNEVTLKDLIRTELNKNKNKKNAEVLEVSELLPFTTDEILFEVIAD